MVFLRGLRRAIEENKIKNQVEKSAKEKTDRETTKVMPTIYPFFFFFRDLFNFSNWVHEYQTPMPSFLQI